MPQPRGPGLTGCWAGGAGKAERVCVHVGDTTDTADDERCSIWNLRKAFCSVANKPAACHAVCQGNAPGVRRTHRGGLCAQVP